MAIQYQGRALISTDGTQNPATDVVHFTISGQGTGPFGPVAGLITRQTAQTQHSTTREARHERCDFRHRHRKRVDAGGGVFLGSHTITGRKGPVHRNRHAAGVTATMTGIGALRPEAPTALPLVRPDRRAPFSSPTGRIPDVRLTAGVPSIWSSRRGGSNPLVAALLARHLHDGAESEHHQRHANVATDFHGRIIYSS